MKQIIEHFGGGGYETNYDICGGGGYETKMSGILCL